MDEDSPLLADYKLPVAIHRPFEISGLKLTISRFTPPRQPEEAGAELPALKISAFDWTAQKWQEITTSKQETLELQLDTPQKFVRLPEGFVSVMVEQTGKGSGFNLDRNISFGDAISIARKSPEFFLRGETKLKYLDIAFAGHEKEK